MALITIKASASDIEPGTYPVILTDLSGPTTVIAKNGPRAGEEVELLNWTFAVDGGDSDGQEITDSSTTASGQKSKLFGWITALTGKPPVAGQGFDPKDLVGRRALANVILSDSGWPKIGSLIALPTSKPKAAAAAPVAAAPAADGSMPF